MIKQEFDIIIIGAGLSGLALAYFLRNQDLNIKILEGRSEIGGRIKTTSYQGTRLEMGATWLHPNHTALQKLLQELGLEIFEQEIGTKAFYEPNPNAPHQLVSLPAHQEPSYRIKGGTMSLIQALFKTIDYKQVVLNCNVKLIEEKENFLLVKTNTENYSAKKVISTLPPYLFQDTIEVIPSLPEELSTIALETHTWMGESIKFGFVFKEPFWKAHNLSGMVFSNAGPVTEMYDHSNAEGSKFALKGFLNKTCFSFTKAQRLDIILNQLEKYYGPKIRDFIDYQELLWEQESFTYAPYHHHLFPHQNNGNELFRKTYLNDNLVIAGTETSAGFPGYMEGAIRSSHWVAELIKQMFAN